MPISLIRGQNDHKEGHTLTFHLWTFSPPWNFAQTTKKIEPHGLPPEDIKSFVQTPKKGGTLIYGRSADSAGLDPAYEVDGNSFMVCDNVFETLIGFKDESTLIDPILAPYGVISSDGLTYTFDLRKGVRFHDGTPFNADAVVFSLGRMMKERKVKFFGKGWNIPKQERSSEYWVSMEMDDTLDSIEAKDEYTVVFKLKRVDAPFRRQFRHELCCHHQSDGFPERSQRLCSKSCWHGSIQILEVG